MFADPDVVDPSVADVATDEFQRIYGSASARLAFLASARNIYLDAPFGAKPASTRAWPRSSRPRCSCGPRTTRSSRPASRRTSGGWLPSAEQIVLDACGHAPQVERPEQVNGLISRFFAQVDALGGAVPAKRPPRAAAA